jgi:hypothetical protein
LIHARENLGIPNALDYEIALEAKGYGPDILHLVTDDLLLEAGLLPGDVIRMKAGCVPWWNSDDAKRKRGVDTDGLSLLRTPPSKKVRYEERYSDGGSKTFFGPALIPGGQVPSIDSEIFYYCPIRRGMAPIPAGFEMPYIPDNDDPFRVT